MDDLTVTNIAYAGWIDGRCYHIAGKLSGPDADARNAQTISEMVGEGYEIREMPITDAVAAYVETIIWRARQSERLLPVRHVD